MSPFLTERYDSELHILRRRTVLLFGNMPETVPVKHVFRQFADFRQISLYSVLAKIFQNFFSIFFYSSASLRPLIREDIGVHILRSGC